MKRAPHQAERFLGAWRIVFHEPTRDSGTSSYLLPSRTTSTEAAARATASRWHRTAAAGTAGQRLTQVVICEVTFRPSASCRGCALAWAARADAGTAEPSELRLLIEEHEAKVVGFGNSVADVIASASPEGIWDVEPYRDPFGRVNWADVRADIGKAAMSTLRQTPYGLLWLDQG
ncbi:hypothetical protein [Streptomyces albofaciens]|uniref:hypothetical protein n=1 Tax=Streptomyces albofaciens TaxID=66866 RepID=UPI0012394BF3|nr:hypothetical protein [Streptomyces albofaciens]